MQQFQFLEAFSVISGLATLLFYLALICLGCAMLKRYKLPAALLIGASTLLGLSAILYRLPMLFTYVQLTDSFIVYKVSNTLGWLSYLLGLVLLVWAALANRTSPDRMYAADSYQDAEQ